MTTQSPTYPDSINTPARKLPMEGNAATEAAELASPELRVRMRKALESGKAHMADWKDGFEEGVRARPIQSILIASAVGAVIGLLIGRRSSS